MFAFMHAASAEASKFFENNVNSIDTGVTGPISATASKITI